jgi:hypothetical protein
MTTIPEEMYPLINRYVAEEVCRWIQNVYPDDPDSNTNDWQRVDESETRHWTGYDDEVDSEDYFSPCTSVNDAILATEKLDSEHKICWQNALYELMALSDNDIILGRLNEDEWLKCVNSSAHFRTQALLLTLNPSKSLAEILEMIKERYQ